MTALRGGLVLLAALAIGAAACDGTDMGFDAQRWAAERGNATGKNARFLMVASLDDAGVRVGTLKPAVRVALGPPDGEGEREDAYFLGRSDVAPDFMVLAIDYAADGRVIEIRTRAS